MSRVAKSPVEIPSGVSVSLTGQQISVKGSAGKLDLDIHSDVSIEQDGNVLRFTPKQNDNWAMAGTTRAIVQNMVVGVSAGFQKTLELVGVGYRAKATGNVVNLTLGYSHPIDYTLPEGITAETPTQTTIVIKGVNKQVVGQVASEIRAFRAPEPYKGKGVRYAGEQVHRKEAKKK
jgi:large subunit ribosomal protein L6